MIRFNQWSGGLPGSHVLRLAPFFPEVTLPYRTLLPRKSFVRVARRQSQTIYYDKGYPFTVRDENGNNLFLLWKRHETTRQRVCNS